MTEYRAGLPERPPRIAALPLDARGYPIPFFVAIVDGQPDFRVLDAKKLVRAVRERLCWICGQRLAKLLAVPVGPMCTVNRISAEPPCHLSCAEYAMRTCPFILIPSANRREANLPPQLGHAGYMLPANPGVMAIWLTKQCPPFTPPGGGVLFRLGDPEGVSWWREGRPATRAEVEAAFTVGLEERLKPLCQGDQEQIADLDRKAERVRPWWPAA